MKIKKAFAIVLAMSMLLSCFSFTVMAEEAVASIDGVEYETLQKAVDAAVAGDIITVISDITLENTLTINKDDVITIDLAGYTVSGESDADAGTSLITNKGNLTITDTSAEANGKITYTHTGTASTSYGNYTIINNGYLTINNGTVELIAQGGGARYPVDNNSSAADTILTLNGGKIVSEYGYAVRQFANSTTYKNDVVVNGGEIIGTRTIWIQLPGNKDAKKLASLTVSGDGKLTSLGESGGYKLATYVYSYGDSFEGVNINISGGIIDGDIAVGGGSGYNGTGAETVNVTGGTFMGSVYTYNSKVEDKISITGGAFAGDVSEYVGSGYIVADNGDGTFTVGKVEIATVGASEATINATVSTTATVVFVTYTASGSIAQIDIKEGVGLAIGENNFSTEITGDSMKVMIWESVASMKPLCQTK